MNDGWAEFDAGKIRLEDLHRKQGVCEDDVGLT
jgi:hypothetical protein